MLVLGVQQSDSIVHIHIQLYTSIGVSMCVCLLILTSGIIPDCFVAFIFHLSHKDSLKKRLFTLLLDMGLPATFQHPSRSPHLGWHVEREKENAPLWAHLALLDRNAEIREASTVM